MTQRSLGVEAFDETLKRDVVETIIPRNTRVPVTKSKIYENRKNYQKFVDLDVYEGEDQLGKNNHLLGEMRLTIPPAIAGHVQIKVTFEIDDKNILHVRARETQFGKEVSITVNNYNGGGGSLQIVNNPP